MKKFLISAFALLLMCGAMFAQDELEYRSKNYPDGGLMYDGYFKDGKPVEVTRYYQNERVQSVQKFDEQGNSTIKMFNENATPFATGSYKGKEKDGVWKFYSTKGVVSLMATYSAGVKNGVVVEYFENGMAMDSMNYSMGKLDGDRSQFYQNGQLIAKFSYKDGVVDGHYASYFDNGQKDSEGDYKNGLRDGVWYFYSQNGAVKEYKFKNGRCKKYEDALKKESADSERNPHIEDPSTDNMY